MPTFQEVQTAVEQALSTALSGTTTVIFANTLADPPTANDFVKVVVIEHSENQLGLGNPIPSRTRGTVAAMIHVKVGKGTGRHTTIREIIKNTLRSKIVGGATFLNSRSTVLGEKATWAMMGVEVPFYFDATS